MLQALGSPAQSRIATAGRWTALAALVVIAGACVDHSTPGKRSKHTADAGELAADGGGGPLCPDGVYDDSAYVETERDLEALRGCQRVTGNLVVSSESLSNLLGLEALTTVEGTLQIGPTWSGETAFADTQFDRFNSLAGLERLRSVGALLLHSLGVTSLEPLARLETAERIEIVHVDGLEDLSGLDRVHWESLRIVQNARLHSLAGVRVPERATAIELSENPLLESTSVLSPLRQLDRLVLQGLPALASLDGLQDLEQIRTELRISHCDALRDLSGLGAVAPTLMLADNAELSSLSGRADRGAPTAITVSNAPKLESLAGLLTPATERLDSLLLMQLPKLTSLGDLAALRELGELTLYTCSALTNVDGLENVRVLSALTVVNAPHLQNLNGLASLERVESSLYLNNAPELSSLRGLAKLERANNLLINGLSSLPDLHGLDGIQEFDGVEIAANAALASLTGLEHVTRVTTLLIANNTALTSLDGLSGLASVQGLNVSANMSLSSLRALAGLSSAEALAIQGNGKLPDCEVEWLAKRVNLQAPRGQNGPTGSCAP